MSTKNFFGWIRSLFCRRRSHPDFLFSPKNSRFRPVVSLPTLILHPGEMMEELSIAICINTQGPVMLGSEDIRAYEVLSPDGNTHVCYFLGVLKDDCCYGNIPGTSCISFCNRKDYLFRESKHFLTPMQVKKNYVYMLECCYDRKAFCVEANRLYKITREDGNQETVLEFEGENRQLGKALSAVKNYLG